MGAAKTIQLQQDQIQKMTAEAEAHADELATAKAAQEKAEGEFAASKVESEAAAKTSESSVTAATEAATTATETATKAAKALVTAQAELATAKAKLSGPQFEEAAAKGAKESDAPDAGGEPAAPTETTTPHYDKYRELQSNKITRQDATAYYKQHKEDIKSEMRTMYASLEGESSLVE